MIRTYQVWQMALGMPDVQQWLEAHTGEAVARQEGDEYFFNLRGD